MLRQDTRIRIEPYTDKQLAGTATEVEYFAANESCVRLRFFDATGFKIASRGLNIPADEELSEETIFKLSGIVPITPASAPPAVIHNYTED